MKANNFIVMFNMRLKELNTPTSDDILGIIIDLIHPKSYISYDEKISLVEKSILKVKDKKYKTPMLYRQLIIDLINVYTNLEMSIEDFDVLSFNKLLNPIIMTFESEYQICEGLMKMMTDDILIDGR